LHHIIKLVPKFARGHISTSLAPPSLPHKNNKNKKVKMKPKKKKGGGEGNV